jgi:hypothetical protein
MTRFGVHRGVMCQFAIYLHHYQSVFFVFFAATPAGIFVPLYPNPSNHGQTALLLSSKASIDDPFCKVRPISSRPLRRQCLRNGSVVNLMGALPFNLLTTSCSRSTSNSRPASASSANATQSASDKVTGNMPFCIALFLKMSAKLGAIMHRIPKSLLVKTTISQKWTEICRTQLTDSMEHVHETNRIQSSCRWTR